MGLERILTLGMGEVVPPIIEHWSSGKIAAETVIILNSLLKFMPRIVKYNPDPIGVLSKFDRSMSKYQAFIDWHPSFRSRGDEFRQIAINKFASNP